MKTPPAITLSDVTLFTLKPPALKPSTVTPQSGSYLPTDVSLLLDIVDQSQVNNVPVAQKEALIQTGQQHYSDMLTLEQAPSPQHQEMYEQALQQGKGRMASDIANLSHALSCLFKEKVSDKAPLILVSLVRAGLPIAVLLQRALSDVDAFYHLPSRHYGVSIIRDRGLDPVAMQTILTAYPSSPIVFVDGWTGKGAIYGELERSLAQYNKTVDGKQTHPNFANIFHQGAGIIPLLTLADPAGVAWLSASSDDWLIPSGLLGSTVSGLISRTLYTKPSSDLTAGLHRSVLYDNLADYDNSLAFVQTIDDVRKALSRNSENLKDKHTNPLPTHTKPRYSTQSIIETLATRYKVTNRNRIKPTIAEATRAVIRRQPDKVLLASADHPDTKLLRHLCEQKKVEITVVGDQILPYQAVTIIKKRN